MFVWNGTWEDGKDHKSSKEVEHLLLMVCKNCGNRTGQHIPPSHSKNNKLECPE